MEWAPILDGELASRGWEVLRGIADGLAGTGGPGPDLALFSAYAHAVLEDDTSMARAAAAAKRFGAELERPARVLGLHGGLAGAGWAAGHLIDDAGDMLSAIDRVLYDALGVAWKRPYDLINGLAGLGVYFVARGDDRALGIVVDQFAATCVRNDAGVTWFSTPQAGGLADVFPDGHYNCGLAHGVPGAIAVLAKIAARGHANAAELRDGAVRWLLAQIGDGPVPIAAGAVGARTGWCYGAPGVALALWHAGRHDHPLVRRWTIDEPIDVRDACLCHGTAGLAHIANRMFHASGDPHYREVARTWFARTLDHYRAGEGIAGFTMDGSKPLRADLLDGTAGVGLALISALAPIDPDWDALMLCDLPGAQ